MRIENKGEMTILYPDEGLLLFKKSDEERTYHDKVYMAKYDSPNDYAEVTYAYAYGESNDEEFVKLQEMVELQSNVLDFIMFSNGVFNKGEYETELISINPLDNLSKYLSIRITSQNLDYDMVISRFPELKNKIDEYLEKDNDSSEE